MVEIELKPAEVDGLSWALSFAARGEGGAWDWTHFDLVNANARAALEADATLPAFARHVLTGADESPRIVLDDSAVAGVIPAYARTGDAEEYDLVCWRFAMTPNRLITGRRRATRTLVHLWERVRDGLEPGSPAALINICITEFAREVRERLADLGGELDAVEDALISDRDPGRLADLGGRLGQVRREATRLKRALTPLARALHAEDEDMPDWVQGHGHETATRGLHDALDDIVALHDRARSLHDELTTRLAEETNRRLYIVSIVTTVVMPATFVTGFFGMNTGGLLWSGDAVRHGTLYAAATCLLAILGTLGLLRWKRML
ncbi:MAG TPA: CorA family divalent cation transporter [Acetobacteraceae bacterium]|nr:CorA family divalent cation transporter [Acetobacteraceae bacterium]